MTDDFYDAIFSTFTYCRLQHNARLVYLLRSSTEYMVYDVGYIFRSISKVLLLLHLPGRNLMVIPVLSPFRRVHTFPAQLSTLTSAISAVTHVNICKPRSYPC